MNQPLQFNAAATASWIDKTLRSNKTTDTNITSLLHEVFERSKLTTSEYWSIYKELIALDYKEEELPFSCRFLWAKIDGLDIFNSADVVAFIQAAPPNLILKNAEVFYKLQAYTKTKINKHAYKAFENLLGSSRIKWDSFPVEYLDKDIISGVLTSYLGEQKKKSDTTSWDYNRSKNTQSGAKMESAALRALVINAPNINWIANAKDNDSIIQITEALIYKDLSNITKKESGLLKSFIRLISSASVSTTTASIQKHNANKSTLLKKISENVINHDWLEELYFNKKTMSIDAASLFENKELAFRIRNSGKSIHIFDYMFRPYLSKTEALDLLDKKGLATIESFINNPYYRELSYFKPYLLAEAYLKKENLTDKERKRVASVCGLQFKDISFRDELKHFNISTEALDLIADLKDSMRYIDTQVRGLDMTSKEPSYLPEV